MGEAGADVVGVDLRVPLDEATRRVGPDRRCRATSTPRCCSRPWDVVGRGAPRSWPPAGPRPGHVFNLGHGVLPETDPDVLTRIVDLVHDVVVAAAPLIVAGLPTVLVTTSGSAWRSAAGRESRRGAGSAGRGTPARRAARPRGRTVRAHPARWRATSASQPSDAQPAAQGRQEAEVRAVVADRRRRPVGGDQGDLDGGQVGDVLELGQLRASSDSRSASRRTARTRPGRPRRCVFA